MEVDAGARKQTSGYNELAQETNEQIILPAFKINTVDTAVIDNIDRVKRAKTRVTRAIKQPMGRISDEHASCHDYPAFLWGCREPKIRRFAARRKGRIDAGALSNILSRTMADR